METFLNEWKLCTKKWALTILLTEILGFVIGFVMLNIVLLIEKNATYVYLGTFFALLMGFVCAFWISSYQMVRYRLLLFMGQKRRNVLTGQILWMILETLIVCAALMCIFTLEMKMYPVLFEGRLLDHDLNMNFLPRYGLLIMGLIVAFAWSMSALSMKFGGKVFFILYIAYLSIWLIGKRLFVRIDFVRSVITKAAEFITSLPAVTWVVGGVAVICVLLYAGYGILYRFDVK